MKSITRKGASIFRSEVGSTMVENSLVLPFLMLASIVVFELLRLGYVSLSLQFSLSRVMRNMTVTQLNATGLEAALSTQLSSLRVPIDPNSDTITFCTIATYGSAACAGGSVQVGNPTQLMVLAIQKPLQSVIIPDYTVVARVVGRLEPE